MKTKATITITALLLMSCAGIAGESHLTGKLVKTAKSHSPYQLQLDGATGSFDLRGKVLNSVPEGAHIWVEGEIHTEMFDSSTASQPSPWPSTWQVFMTVTDCRRITRPFEMPDSVARPTESEPTSRVDGGTTSTHATQQSRPQPRTKGCPATIRDLCAVAAALHPGMAYGDVMRILNHHGTQISGATGGTVSTSASVTLEDGSQLSLYFRKAHSGSDPTSNDTLTNWQLTSPKEQTPDQSHNHGKKSHSSARALAQVEAAMAGTVLLEDIQSADAGTRGKAAVQFADGTSPKEHPELLNPE